MRTQQKGLQSKKRIYLWAALVCIFTLLVALVASAQEKACDLSTSKHLVEITANAQQTHSEHCIRHQDPLPEIDGTKSSITGMALSIEMLFSRPSRIDVAFSRIKVSIPNIVTFAGSGIAPFKRLAHFLI